jgi:hypothetical protein
MATKEVSAGFRYRGLAAYVASMERWIYPEVQRAVNRSAHWGAERMLFGCLVYGDRYVDRFIEFCLPSLLASGNVEIFRGAKFLFHTDAGNKKKLEKAFAVLESYGEVDVRVVPQDVLRRVTEHPPNKYWLLGAANFIHMHTARWGGYGFHLLMPDHIYSMGFFGNLKRLRDAGHQAIVRGGLSAKLEEVAPILKARGCAFKPEDLNALAMDHLHPQFEALILNGRDDYPISSLVVMVIEGAAVVVSPHAAAVYLSNGVLRRSGLKLFNTIDGQLPYIIPDDIIPYHPGPQDGMSYIEVSDVSKEANPRGSGWTLVDFCVEYWLLTYGDRKFVRYLKAPTIMSFPKGYKPPVKPMGESEFGKKLLEMWQAIAKMEEPMKKVYADRKKFEVESCEVM